MKKPFIQLLLSVVLFLGLAGCSGNLMDDVSSIVADTSAEESVKMEVVINQVTDGDTVNVEMPDGSEESVRLLLIDTPESVHPDKPDQPYGEKASQFATETLQKGQTVTLEVGNPKRDKYDRLLGYIWIDDTNFNQLMIEKGYARVAYVQESNTKYLEEFKKAEDQAEEKDVNIWSIDGYVENKFEMY